MKTRLLASYVAILILLIVISAMGLIGAYTIGSHFDKAIHQSLPVLRVLDELRDKISGTLVLAEQLQHSTTLTTDKVTNSFNGTKETLGRYRGLVEQHFPDELETLEEIENIFDEFNALLSGIGRSRESYEALHVHGSALIQQISEAVGHELGEFDALSERVTGDLKWHQGGLLALMVFTITIAVLSLRLMLRN